MKILAFLVTLLSGEFLHQGNDSATNSSGSGKDNVVVQVDDDLKIDDCLKRDGGGCKTDEKNCKNDEPRRTLVFVFLHFYLCTRFPQIIIVHL